MRYGQIPAGLVIFVLAVGLSPSLPAQDQLQISEFLAFNEHGLDDEDRDEEDWIEIHNAGAGPASLEGWYLTDTPKDPTKWQFPAVTLEPDGYLVVFASGKDRRDPAGVLHTNFKLSGTGEYLGLVRPDGVTVVSEYAPAFPIQAPDVSYGLSGTTTQKVLLARGRRPGRWCRWNDALEPPPESAGAAALDAGRFRRFHLAVRHDGRGFRLLHTDRAGRLRHAQRQPDGLRSGPLRRGRSLGDPGPDLADAVRRRDDRLHQRARGRPRQRPGPDH